MLWWTLRSSCGTPSGTSPFENVPTPAEVAEAGYAFASKLLADQSRFLEELGHAMTASKGAGKAKKGS